MFVSSIIQTLVSKTYYTVISLYVPYIRHLSQIFYFLVLNGIIFSECVNLLGMFSVTFGHIAYVEVQAVTGLSPWEAWFNPRLVCVCVCVCVCVRARARARKGQWDSFYLNTMVFPCHFSNSAY
jgi:hypothetical protein